MPKRRPLLHSRRRHRLWYFRWSGIAVAALLSACTDSADPTKPDPTTAPAALELTLPESVVAGQPFSLSVSALRAIGGGLDDRFNGSVSLSTSSGSLTPATLVLTNGTGSGEFTLNGTAGPANITARIGSTSSMKPLVVIGRADPVRIEITPGTLLLTQAGETRQLTAQAYDAAGQPTVAEFVWRSSSAAVSVTPEGLATATAAAGSAQIVAEAGGISSSPALALVAQPVQGTRLIADEQVAGDPVPIDPADQFGDGWRYRVLLRGVTDLSPGATVIGSGEAIVAGRVVSTSPADSLTAVTLELTPLDQLFQTLEIHVDLPLEETEIPSQASAFLPRPFSGVAVDGNELDFPLGPFKCKVGAGALPEISLQNVQTPVTGSLTGSFDFSLAKGFGGVKVGGSVSGQMSARPTIDLLWAGNAKCERDVKEFTLPIGGWLALFFGFQVPVGYGFALEGELDVGEVGFDISTQASASLELGFTCPEGGACSAINSFDSSAEGEFKLVSPEDLQDLRIRLDGRGYLYAKLALGPSKELVNSIPALAAVKFKLLEANAGFEQNVDLASSKRQASDPAYASRLATLFNAEVKADLELKQGFSWFEKKLGVTIQILDVPLWEYETVLAETPRGTLKIEPTSVLPGNDEELGEMATFIIELDPVTYLGLDAVEKVEIRWKKVNEQGEFTLENGRPSCHEISAGSGQKKFECETDFLEEHEGEQTFYAFAHVKVFGVPLPVPLEIANDARAVVKVGEGCEWDYCEDFEEGTPGSEWSEPTIETSPSGERFLGLFANEKVTLSLSELPEHTEIDIEVDVYIVGSWDGGFEATGPIGEDRDPDVFEVELDGMTLLVTTFSQESKDLQTYPGSFPGAVGYPATTGARAVNSLGSVRVSINDSIYRLTFTQAHSASNLLLTFGARDLTGSEAWGIDNVRLRAR